MKIPTKNILLFLCAVCIFAGFVNTSCATPAAIKIRIMPITAEASLYYFSPTEWLSKNNKNTMAKLDISYRSDEDNPVICNISFFNTDKAPDSVTEIVLSGEGKDFPLNDVSVLIIKPENYELRITSTLHITELMELFESKTFSLKANIDGIVYQYDPHRDFYTFRNQFLDAFNL
ncbi:MAG: hypothetical protein LBU66_00515 [Treponema sp.]|jgi:hypothetical protein|nr:hypothetical protein [Treponema sp.]